MKKLFFMLLGTVITNLLTAQQEIQLYPDGATESNGIVEEVWRDNDFLLNIKDARMYAYFAPSEKTTGTAILICPGGAYSGVSAIKEGEEFAQWLNNLGVSAFVLYYRMPNGHYNIPLKDAQTALEIIYKNADDWEIDKEKIGIAGFSAGGHLASTAGTHFTSDQNRPDFMALLYPVVTMKAGVTHDGSRKNLLGDNPSEELIGRFSNEMRVTHQTPRTFILATIDDDVVPVENSRLFFNALKENKIKVCLKTYEKGGHGFGLRKQDLPVDSWPDVFKKWLKSNNYID